MYKFNGFIFVFYLIIIACGNKQMKDINYNGEANEILKIEFSFEDLNTLTFAKVTCDEFENIFENVIKKRTINNKIEINKIYSNLEETLKENKKTKNLDTRFKMKIIYKNQSERTICGNGRVIKINDINYLISKKFSLLLYEMTSNNSTN